LPQQVFSCLGQIRNLSDKYWSHHRTQCTRLRTSGEPKRLVRGGGTSSGISDVARGLKPAPRSSKLRIVSLAASPAGINKTAVLVVLGDQQRAEPGSGTFRIGPADYRELVAVQAFGFDPQTAIPRRIRLIGALRDERPQL